MISLNRIATWVFVAGYLVVNGRLQFDFFAGRDIFAKYVGKSVPHDAAGIMRIASDSYYAKTDFLLILILLQVVAGFSLALSLALSASAYAAMMLMFFGVTPPTILFAIGALSLVGTYFWDRNRGALRKNGENVA